MEASWPPKGCTRSVIVVDDSEVVLEVASSALSKAGWCVRKRTEAIGTAAEVLRYKPTVLLIDLNLPIVKGGALIDLIRRITPPVVTKLVLHSASRHDVEEEARRCRADGFIVKGDNLVKALNAILR